MRPVVGWRLAVVATLLLSAGLAPSSARAQVQNPPPAAGADLERKINLNLRDVPLRKAIELLFTGTGMQYAVEANVPDVPINLNVRDLNLQAALRLVIRLAASQVPGLTQARDGDVYVIRIRPPAPVAAVETDTAPPDEEEGGEFTWEKIPVQFNNVAVFVIAFGGSMLPTEADVVMSSMGGMGGGMGGGMMGGMGGMGGGMMGGMGGMGGGMMGGMGGMGGGMGGFGGGGFGGFGGGGMGGMGGGMGGFGGGGLGGFGGGGMGGGFGGGGMGGGFGSRF
jgi:hypothetical protein